MANKTIVKFFELKFEQLVLQVLARLEHQVAYTQDEVDKMSRYVNLSGQLEKQEEKLLDFIKSNVEELEKHDLHELAKLTEYRVTQDRQKELSKALVDKEWTVDELMVELGKVS